MSNLPFLTFGPENGTPVQRWERGGVSHLVLEERFAERLKEREEQIRKEAVAAYKAGRGARDV